MGILVRKSDSFELPSRGWHQAVLAQVEDMGLIKTQFGENWKLKLIFDLDEKGTNGERFQSSIMVTRSLHEKSKLHSVILSWLGEVPEELDLEALCGRRARVHVDHNTGSKGGIFANVTAVMPSGNEKPKPTSQEAPFEATEDDIPF